MNYSKYAAIEYIQKNKNIHTCSVNEEKEKVKQNGKIKILTFSLQDKYT